MRKHFFLKFVYKFHEKTILSTIMRVGILCLDSESGNETSAFSPHFSPSTLLELPPSPPRSSQSSNPCHRAARMAGGSGEGAAMSPPSSSGVGGGGGGGKRGRDPEEDVYVDNLHSHKRYLSEVGAPSVSPWLCLPLVLGLGLNRLGETALLFQIPGGF